MIGKVARHDLPQPGALLVNRGVLAAAQGLLDLAQLGPQPVAPRLPVQRELAVPGAPADVGEAQKVKGLRLAKPAPLTVRRRMAAELDQARLVRMQAQREAFQPLAQGRQKPLGIGRCSKPATRSSAPGSARSAARGQAPRTTMTLPLAWRCRHCRAQRSRT